jgi:hypothetical protein
MAKATKSRSSKSKTRKSKATASKTRKRVASTAARGRRRNVLATPIVCVVTPTDPTTASISAFCNELITNAAPGQNFILQIYSAIGSDLDTVAGLAANANPAPAAILACGSDAAGAILSASSSVQVVMVGGEVPSNATSTSKLTGYTLEGKTTAKYHLGKLKGNDITVLLDDTNEISVQIWNDLTGATQSPPLSPVKMGQNQIIPLPVDNPGLIQQKTVTTPGFMLIPNAMFYLHCAEIAAMVDASLAQTVYYPEQEYKDASKSKTQTITVYGHDIPGTFEDAADIVRFILKGKSPPKIKAGRKFP